MERAKELFEQIKKHGFWITCGLVTIISVVVWWMSTAALAEDAERQKRKLLSQNRAITTIQNRMSDHPNDQSHALMNDMIKKRRTEVLKAWKMQYDQQQKILFWPTENLGADVVAEFKPLFPIEKIFRKFPVPVHQRKELTFRERYRDYIGNTMQDMAKIAGAKWTAQFAPTDRSNKGISGFSTNSGNVRPRAENGFISTGSARPPLVIWSKSSQEALLDDLFPWRGSVPSTLQVLYSQENLWVLKQLLEIISVTNRIPGTQDQAQERFQAKIHEIHTIAIGRGAARAEGAITPAKGKGSQTASSTRAPTQQPNYPSMGMMPQYRRPKEKGINADDPAENRYVDMNYRPVKARRVREAMFSDKPEDAKLAVAKRIPVKMHFDIDQRAIPTLLAACGNASLMVEVRQLRIKTKSAQPGGAKQTNDPSKFFPMDVAAEVYGIIHLYNPPSVDRLGLEQVDQNTVVDGNNLVTATKEKNKDKKDPTKPPSSPQPSSPEAKDLESNTNP